MSAQLSFYEREIKKVLAEMGVDGEYEIAQVEAWMRLEHGTLDHLGAGDFRAEVKLATKCIDADPLMSRKLAGTY